MRPSFVLLVIANTTLLILTAWTGTHVEGANGFSRHFLLGILAAFFTVFVHLVVFVYFIVQDKIVKQSVLLNGLDSKFAARVDRHKFVVLLASIGGICAVLVISILGGGGGTVLRWHGACGFALPAVNLVIAVRQYVEIVAYGRTFREAFSE